MNGKRILIIGSQGRYGMWLAEFMRCRGNEVKGYDLKMNMPINFKWHLVEEAEIIILTVPSEQVAQAAEEIRDVVRHDHLIINTASKQVPGLKALHERTVAEVCGLHILADLTDRPIPEGAILPADVTVAFCVDTRILTHSKCVERFLSSIGGRVEKVLASDHDRIMDDETNLPRLNALAQAIFLGNTGVDSRELMRFETKLGGMSHAVVRRVLSQSDMLDAELLVGSPRSVEMIDELVNILLTIRTMVHYKNVDGLVALKRKARHHLGDAFMNPEPRS